MQEGMDSHKTNGVARHLLLGQVGEEIAANWLMNNGYRILDRNWKLKNSYELDIIAFKDNLIHFIEVKTRDRSSGSNPLTAIDKRKLFHIYRAGMLYKKYYRLNFDSVMHAISIVYGSDTEYELKFIPNIHQAMTAMGYYSHHRN